MLAIVLVLIFVLVSAVYNFQRRAIIDTSIAKNRLKSDEAYALARGGLRIGEAVAYLARLKQGTDVGGASPEGLDDPASGPGAALLPPDALWAGIGAFPLEFEGGRTLRISIEDEGARLNLNALVDPNADVGEQGEEEAEEYLRRVLEYIIDGIDGTPEGKNYDPGEIALNLLDYMDADDIARNGRDENSYYRTQDPPYRARNGPFLSLEEIGLVEGVDPPLLDAMREPSPPGFEKAVGRYYEELLR